MYPQRKFSFISGQPAFPFWLLMDQRTGNGYFGIYVCISPFFLALMGIYSIYAGIIAGHRSGGVWYRVLIRDVRLVCHW